jgi:hypothetical protein
MNSNKFKFYVLAISCLCFINCKQSPNDPVSIKNKKIIVKSNEKKIANSNEKIIDSLIIDLNNDGKLDKIEIKEKNNSERTLLVQIKEEKGYKLISNNNEIIGCLTCGFQGGDPYISLNKSNKGFEIELEYIKLSFFYESNALYLKKVDVLKTEPTETGITENHEIFTYEQFGKMNLSDLKKDFIVDLRKRYGKTENNIEGLYILHSCEKSRFKIKIEEKEKVYYFSILDEKKVISKGKAILINNHESTSIELGKMGGLYTAESIVIQNYGNSMNEYNHFTQCDQKYLTFEKVKQ